MKKKEIPDGIYLAYFQKTEICPESLANERVRVLTKSDFVPDVILCPENNYY